jgi:hypothetical protein
MSYGRQDSTSFLRSLSDEDAKRYELEKYSHTSHTSILPKYTKALVFDDTPALLLHSLTTASGRMRLGVAMFLSESYKSKEIFKARHR